MIQKFLCRHPDQKTRSGQAAVDDGGTDGFTGAAGVLRTGVTPHEEACGLDIKLLAHVLADLEQITTALAAGAGAGFRFVPLFDARQVFGQGLATGALTRLACGG